MIKQEYILLIMNCEKYRDKAEKQNQDWLKNIPSFLKYFHVIGGSKEERLDEENNILYLNVDDDYISLPKKVIAAYNAINTRYDYSYIFKTDDDQMLKKPTFFDVLKSILERKNEKGIIHYGGFIIDVKQPYLSKYHLIHPELPEYLPVYQTKYCNGRFYFLSKESIEYLISFKKMMISREYLEDYAIGFHLNMRYKENMLNLNTNDYFIDFT
jgi:hypothetical protein